MKQFNLVVCGGTFDHFHKGHKAFLKSAFSAGEKVIIGITSDKYIQSSKSEAQSSMLIEPFKKRKQSVLKFLRIEKVSDKAEIIEIDNLFGPALDKNYLIDAIVVSRNTVKGAEIINKKRSEIGLAKLKIIVTTMVLAQDGQEISSSKIRNGNINRDGRLYVDSGMLSKALIITDTTRKNLKKPLGVLFKNLDNLNIPTNAIVATAGDITSQLFNRLGVNQHISVIDFLVNRKKSFTKTRDLGFSGQEKIINVDNPAGSVTPDLFKAVEKAIKLEIAERAIIKVKGEEDLAVLPLVLLLPLGSCVFYGQPQRGIVLVEVTEKNKDKVIDALGYHY